MCYQQTAHSAALGGRGGRRAAQQRQRRRRVWLCGRADAAWSARCESVGGEGEAKEREGGKASWTATHAGRRLMVVVGAAFAGGGGRAVHGLDRAWRVCVCVCAC